MSLFPKRINEGLPKTSSFTGFKKSTKYIGFPKNSNGLPRGNNNGYTGVIDTLKTFEDMDLDEKKTKVKITDEVKEVANDVVKEVVNNLMII